MPFVRQAEGIYEKIWTLQALFPGISFKGRNSRVKESELVKITR